MMLPPLAAPAAVPSVPAAGLAAAAKAAAAAAVVAGRVEVVPLYSSRPAAPVSFATATRALWVAAPAAAAGLATPLLGLLALP
jgi:hypothetical protein